MNEQDINNEEPIRELKETNVFIIILIVFAIFFLILFLMFLGVSRFNAYNDRIASGIYIKNINVSGLEKQEAIELINKELSEYMDENIILKYNENYTTEISLEQLDASFDVESAIELAYSYGRNDNIFVDSFQILSVMVSNINIEPVLNINEEELRTKLDGISAQLPDTIVQSSYYIEDTNLIITKGKAGNLVDTDKMFEILKQDIQNLDFTNKPYELEIIQKNPDNIDIEKIHNEIYKQPVNATYTVEPYLVTPSEDGIDFNISIEDAKQIIKSEQEEYIIPLKIIKPQITTNMIGAEAFPDLISNFSTRYNQRQVDRTTNLRLASEKINGTVIMPGEIFSYNTVVGKRTIEAGYKEAPIYVNGQVEDGLGGGICQVSTTLYNAALYANLEIVERRNHQFIPSYAGAGLDATVVYGSIDFKIRNNRNYPIKIVCSVENGICNFELYGLKEQTEYEVVVGANIISRSATWVKSKTYRTLKLNGEEIKTELLSADTYKTH